MHFLAILFLANAHAINCKSPANQIEMNICATAEFDRADANLKRQWKITLPKIAAKSKGLAEKFRTEQRNWVYMRGRRCNEDFPWDLESSANKMRLMHCLTDMTIQRTNLLAKLAAKQP